MINKVERLVSIGKFRDYTASGQVNFKKLTLIYGDNGGGKTTLTSVFRSVAKDDESIIRSRISTNSTSPQAAQITQTGTPLVHHTFGANGWTLQFPDIEIFDIHFVNENVYSGFDFNEEHKKHLHQFVIGAQGIAIQTQIEQNKAAKAQSRQTQTTIQNQIIQQVGHNLSPDLISAFLTIPITDANGIDALISTAQTALTNANANSVIQTLNVLSAVNKPNFGINYTQIRADLGTTIETIQDQALKALFDSHCSELEANGVESAETWLKKGLSYVQTKRSQDVDSIQCPFCRVTVDEDDDILKAYTAHFNEAFNALVQRVQLHLTSLQAVNLEAAILSIKGIEQTNGTRVVSWTPHLPNSVVPPSTVIVSDDQALKTGLGTLIENVQQKLQNPSTAISSQSLDQLEISLGVISTNIDAYNQEVSTYNTAISTFKATIVSVANAQLEVDRLSRIKKRFDPAISTLCTQLEAEKTQLRALEAAYPNLIQQQQAAATTFFTNYQSRINHYLTAIFKTHYRIEDVVHVAPQGRSTQSKIGYKLTINGEDISFNPSQPLNAKDCLSEGDKSTIALALFLAKLDIDPNSQSKILIFDDPLSSLDTNRRTHTISLIRGLCQHMSQVVVLSHNEYFLHEIAKDVPNRDKCTLRVTENFAAMASVIEPCDLDELVKNDYFKHIDAIEEFRTNPNHAIKDSVLGWLRNVLESHLRFKFHRELRTMPGQKTFGRLIDYLDTSGVVFSDNQNRASIISTLKLINGVSWRPHHGIPMPNYNTLGINPNTISAPELDGLIQDTLTLIDSQL